MVLVIVLIMSFSFPHVEGAQPNYGGHSRSIIVPCTCGGASAYIDFFYPLYLDSGVPVGGFMGMPYSLTYLNYYIYPNSWAIGKYTPGAGICLVGVSPYCTTMPTYGLILPYSGSSIPSL